MTISAGCVCVYEDALPAADSQLQHWHSKCLSESDSCTLNGVIYNASGSTLSLRYATVGRATVGGCGWPSVMRGCGRHSGEGCLCMFFCWGALLYLHSLLMIVYNCIECATRVAHAVWEVVFQDAEIGGILRGDLLFSSAAAVAGGYSRSAALHAGVGSVFASCRRLLLECCITLTDTCSSRTALQLQPAIAVAQCSG
jgi:hypothetical protein